MALLKFIIRKEDYKSRDFWKKKEEEKELFKRKVCQLIKNVAFHPRVLRDVRHWPVTARNGAYWCENMHHNGAYSRFPKERYVIYGRSERRMGTVSHKSHDPCIHVFLMEAKIMTFVAHCTLVTGTYILPFGTVMCRFWRTLLGCLLVP